MNEILQSAYSVTSGTEAKITNHRPPNDPPAGCTSLARCGGGLLFTAESDCSTAAHRLKISSTSSSV
jgi:hypothetical protein